MHRTSPSPRVIGPRIALAVTTAMAGALLTGCATTAAPRADLSASAAQAALAGGKSRQAVAHAEAAVSAEPRNAAYRAILANAYLDAGRFASAEATYADALALGDTAPRTALSLALAMIGEGKLQQAGTVLSQWQDRIAPADLGLALALAGQPDRGVVVMSNAIRGGDNNTKIRQNLAYAYALGGRWREARLMASQDLAGDQVGDRMEQWAEMVQPEAWQTRIAALLHVPASVRDGGQPVELALASKPGAAQLAVQTAPSAPPPAGELPALAVQTAAQPAAIQTPAQTAVAQTGAIQPGPIQLAALQPVVLAPAAAAMPVASPAPVASVPPAMASAPAATFAKAFAEPAVAASSMRAVAQDAAAFASPAQRPAARERAARPSVNGLARLTPASARLIPAVEVRETTHLIQLGSFASQQGARRAWEIYTAKYPALAGHQLVISEAVVRGKHYWRVSAGGYGHSSASSTCGIVHEGGGGCFAYAEGHPLPGALDRGIRLASR